MRVLSIGDPHVRPSNIEESARLLGFCVELASREGVDRIEVLGDLFHTHFIVRLDVMEFWREWAPRLAEVAPTYMLVGNHDMPGDRNSEARGLSALDSLPEHPRLKVVRGGHVGPDGIAYLSYVHSSEEFLAKATALSQLLPGNKRPKTLVCHATVQGSRYENGFYAPDGVDPELVPFEFIRSGHIHATQEFGKVHYPGTPRWDGASDANQAKGVWLIDHDGEGRVVSKRMVSTEGVCVPLVELCWREGEPMPDAPEGARVTWSLEGTSAWVATAKRAALSSSPSATVRASYTDRARKSGRGGSTPGALEEFLGTDFEPQHGVSKEEILHALKELA